MTDEDRGDEGQGSPREDPFEHLDGDREGDPFANLGGPADAGDRDGPPADGPPDDPVDEGSDPFEGGVSRADADPERAGSASGPERADPAGDPTATDPFGEFEARDGDPFESAGGAFERVDVGDVDPDEVWESIAGDASGDGAAADLEWDAESRYADVSKHEFCERCEHFSPPPAVDCGHGDAEIVEFLDSETVRLLNCPVVAERRRIEDEE